VQERKMPPPGQRPSKAEPSEQTLLEMEAGRRAVAGAEANPDLWRALIDPETGFEK
jgi:hypothetical protein